MSNEQRKNKTSRKGAKDAKLAKGRIKAVHDTVKMLYFFILLFNLKQRIFVLETH